MIIGNSAKITIFSSFWLNFYPHDKWKQGLFFTRNIFDTILFFTRNIFGIILFFTKNTYICGAKQSIEHYGQTV